MSEYIRKEGYLQVWLVKDFRVLKVVLSKYGQEKFKYPDYIGNSVEYSYDTLYLNWTFAPETDFFYSEVEAKEQLRIRIDNRIKEKKLEISNTIERIAELRHIQKGL